MDADLTRITAQIPSGLFVMTAAYDRARTGVLVRWVQQCAARPPMVMVALATGLPIVPLIRDSRSFALCQISSEDRLLKKKFAEGPDPGEDPFVTLPIITAPSGAPVLERSLSYLDCELARHIDIESDHGLYVGIVRHAALLSNGRPAVRVGNDDVGK